ncbi:hypothetical protein NGB36_15385 [Streptomyces sp. RB6PN25]|uniref:Integrase n=1 Tax=Streptomyces humicola TaxID=2953240 RepID=A0ABT1PXX4_9ACTN|nr:hypothetical protein [Streptomyces humicola]MCQ4081953.1 hypothetical protein [Streptomyces humicola]
MEFTQAKHSTVRDYRTAITRLATWVDEHCGTPEKVSLGAPEPDAAGLIREWSRGLPSGFKPGSMRPSLLGENIRTLIRLRAQREDAPLTDSLRRLLDGPMWVPLGRAQELDEFTLQERNAMVRAAWTDVRALEERLARGRALIAAADGHPKQFGYTAANMLRALADGLMTMPEIGAALPRFAEWPQELIDLARMRGTPVKPNTAVWQLRSSLASLLYPRNGDYQAFRILLMAATGHTPEEVTGLNEDDVEFVPGGVHLTLTKMRARRVRHRMFRDREVALHTAHGRVSAPEVVRRLLAVTERVRADCGLEPAPLFVSASVQARGEVRFLRFQTGNSDGRFGLWVQEHGLEVYGKLDIRRLRKTVKVEKAIALGGRVSDVADDHTEQTFWGHYAHGTTLHLISGDTITRAQRTWLDKALTGPMVVDQRAEDKLEVPEALDALGLTREEAEELRSGALDMGVTSCRDPFASPYSRPGDLCAVAPLRCLECRNAFILPSNLPQLLLFSDYLDGLRQRLTPRHFHALWGQSAANLTAVLAERSEIEIANARRQIDSQAMHLQLPLAAYTEFDQ